MNGKYDDGKGQNLSNSASSGSSDGRGLTWISLDGETEIGQAFDRATKTQQCCCLCQGGDEVRGAYEIQDEQSEDITVPA